MQNKLQEKFSALLRRRTRLSGPGLQPSGRRHKLLKRITLGITIFVLAFTVIGFLIVPPVAKHYLVKGLGEALGRPVAIESIKLNPFAMIAVVKGFTVKERDASTAFLNFAELRFDLQTKSLFRLAPVLREIVLTDPYVHIVRNPDARTYNFSDLIEKFASPTSPRGSETGRAARFSLNNVQIINGRIEIDDQPKHAHHTVREINIAIPTLSNLPYEVNDYVEPSFSALVNDTPFSLQGRTKPFQDTLETSVDINIEKLNIPRYMEYVPVDPGFHIRSGTLDARLTLTFVRARNRPPMLWMKGNVALHDLGMTERDGKPLLNLGRLEVPITASNVSRSEYVFGTIALQKPEVFVRRNHDGSLNWMAVAPSNETTKDNAPKNEKPAKPDNELVLSVPEVKISDGIVHVSDLVPDKSFKTDLSNLQAALRGFALPQTEPALAELAFGTGFGEKVNYAGSLMLSPLASEGTVEVRKVRLTNYRSYYQDLILYRLEDGIADLSTHYAFNAAGKSPDVKLSDLNLVLAAVRMRKPGAQEDFLFAKSAQIKDASLDLGKRSVTVGEFITSHGFLGIVREKDGGINAARIVPASRDARTGKSGGDGQGPPWLFMLKRADLRKWKISFTDLGLPEPAKFVADAVTLQARDISNQQDHKGQIELGATLNETGALTLKGPLAINPVAAELRIDLKNFGLVPLQPYFADKINILLTNADLSVAGNTKLALPPEGPPAVVFDGEASLTNFASVDKAKSEDFLKWAVLHVGGIAYNHNPMRLAIEQVALSDFYSRIIIFPDGRLNLQGIAATSAEGAPTVQEESPKQDTVNNAASATAAPAETGKPAPPIRIGKVTLQNGDVNFTDLFIKPNYSANLNEVGGSVIGLSSQLDTTAEVDLRGRFAKTSPVEIKGRINPLVKNLFLDLKASVRDIELGPFTPYAGKFVGYAIEKGKMSFNVTYKIENRKLAASNQIVVNQLTFGGKVESPQATKLPVLLAVALLKDRNGVIDINLPISGSLDDPKFSIGGLIVKVIINLVTKAITAPFALIGNLVGGGGEELSYVEFDPGSSALTAEGQNKLTTLRKGLTNRPALRLDITPRADPAKDREGQRRNNFERQLKAQKLKDLVKRGAAVKSVDDVTIAPEEYEKYLRRAYKAAKFAKPRNIVGFVKELPVEETEKLMLTDIQVSNDDLVKLANERGQAAKDFLTRSEEVALERVFLLAPKVEAPKPDDKLKGSRVDFSLK